MEAFPFDMNYLNETGNGHVTNLGRTVGLAVHDNNIDSGRGKVAQRTPVVGGAALRERVLLCLNVVGRSWLGQDPNLNICQID